MVFAGNSLEMISEWLSSKDGKPFQTLDPKMIPAEFLNDGFTSHTSNDASSSADCEVHLIDARQATEHFLDVQLAKLRWKCIIAQHPVLIGGLEPDLKLNQPESRRRGRPGRMRR